jgi:hypothetical protein
MECHGHLALLEKDYDDINVFFTDGSLGLA